MKLLLSAKANVKAKDKQGTTVLSWALQFGDELCVSALRAAGAKEGVEPVLKCESLLSLQS